MGQILLIYSMTVYQILIKMTLSIQKVKQKISRHPKAEEVSQNEYAIKIKL